MLSQIHQCQCSSITILMHQVFCICFFLEASGDSYTEDIRVRIYGCLCTPRKKKGGGGRVLQMQRTDCFSSLMIISHYLCNAHLRIMLLWPLPSFTNTPLSDTHTPAAAYLKTRQWRPLLGIVYNADFEPLWLLILVLSVLNRFLFSLSLSLIFSRSFRHFTGHIGHNSFCQKTKKGKIQL